MNSDLASKGVRTMLRMAFALMLAVSTVWMSGSTTPAHAARIAIVVNGSAITTTDVNRRIKLLQLQRTGGNLKKKAQEQLIEEAIKMREIARLRASVPDSMVNQSFERFAKSNKMSSKKMEAMLGKAGVTADHFKEFMRVQMSWPRVVDARFGGGGRMSTEDLVSKMLEQGGEKPTTTEYILQQVIFVVPQSKRGAILGKRKREAESMRQRFANCKQTRDFAKGLTDVSVRDLGRVLRPALPRDWKTLVENTSAGRTTKTRTTDRGVEFIAVCSAKEVSDDLAAEMVFSTEKTKDTDGSNKNSEKYLKELRDKARVVYK